MHYLITGGAGFIGSHLTERLLRDGARVTVFDDMSTGRVANLAGVAGHPRLQVQVASVRSPRKVRAAVAAADAVVHFAAAVGVDLVTRRPLRALLTNVEGSLNVLRAAADRRRPILLASSSELYGTGGDRPSREEDPVRLGPTAEPRWGYAAAKALDEWLALAHAQETGLDVRVVRFFNVAGPRQRGRYGMVLPRFARRALLSRPLRVHGDGTQTRCFCHVRDAVEAVTRLLAHPAAAGAVVNVGSDREISVRELAERVSAMAGTAAPIRHVAARTDDVRRRVPDLRRLVELTGFQPSTGLDELVADALEDQRQRLARSAAPAV